MANLYGVANAPVLFAAVSILGGADIVPPINGTETNIFQAFMTAPSQGWFYPACFCWITLGLGATPPTGLNFGFRVNGGADMQSLGVNSINMAANAQYIFTPMMVGGPSQGIYQSGANLQVTVICNSTVAIDIRAGQSTCTFALFRAPDQ